MSSENHIEKYKLLGVSGSDSGSEIPEFILPKRKVKTKKKHRPNGTAKSNLMLQRSCCSVIFILKVLAVLIVAITLIVTVWLAVNLHLQVDDLQQKYSQVEESGKSTPSEFHAIHSQLNDLLKNQSALKEEVDQLNKTLESISKELSSLKKSTADIQKTVAGAPQLETLPKEFQSLSQSLAAMGSKITDLKTNLDLVKGQLANGDKDKQHWQDVMTEMQKKMEAVSAFQDKGDNTNLFTYVDNEVKKLDDILYETNTSIWEKLNFAIEDLHEHHKSIESNKNASQNLTARLTKLESAALGNSSSLTDIYEQLPSKVNESVKAAINALLPTTLRSINIIDNGTITISTLVDYVKNLTRIYIALLADTKSLSKSAIANLNDSIDLNIKQMVQDEVHSAVDAALEKQNPKIQELQTALWKLNETVEQFRYVTSAKSVDVNNNKATVAVETVTQTLNASSLISPSTVTQSHPIEEVKTSSQPTNQSLKSNSSLSDTQAPSVQDPQSTGVASNFNSSVALNVTSNATTPNPPESLTTAGVVIHKPSQTGSSLNKPELRPESPPPD